MKPKKVAEFVTLKRVLLPGTVERYMGTKPLLAAVFIIATRTYI